MVKKTNNMEANVKVLWFSEDRFLQLYDAVKRQETRRQRMEEPIEAGGRKAEQQVQRHMHACSTERDEEPGSAGGQRQDLQALLTRMLTQVIRGKVLAVSVMFI